MTDRISDKVETLAKPIVEDMDLELVEVAYVKEGPDWFLRVYIDSAEGIGIDQCARASESLSEALDAANVISDAYYLEVSSPGVERPLKTAEHFKASIGKQVKLTTYAPIESHKSFEGELSAFDGEAITLKVKQKTAFKDITIPYDKVASARLAVTF